MGTSKRKEDKETEEDNKQNKVKLKKKSGYKIKKSQSPAVAWAYCPFCHYYVKKQMNYITNLTLHLYNLPTAP